MHVENLLEDESLGLRLLWADDPLLRREISGVTATDLEDPARFVRPGEVVLSGLVWWTPEDGQARAERFVAALKTAGAAVLLAARRLTARSPPTWWRPAGDTGCRWRRSRSTSCSVPSPTRCTCGSGASWAAITPCPETYGPG
ncbi:PucR family transcriptional regulator ligand-binding domain-containing protein [Streptomyces kaempferi]